MIYKDPDGRELTVGRIFRNHGLAGGERPWFDFFQRQGRAEPRQGQVDTLEEAKAAWRKCWGFGRRAYQLAAVDAEVVDAPIVALGGRLNNPG